MWKSLGFKESPYDTSPLKAKRDDIDLLVGRSPEATEFVTALDSAKQGIVVLSGAPGVGKTSFLNVQQYKMEVGLTWFGPTSLYARHLCPVQPSDSSRDLALRALDSYFKSVSDYCSEKGLMLPKETKKIGGWISNKKSGGFSLGVTVLGIGGNISRSVQLPSLSDATFENIMDAISVISSEVVSCFDFDCSIIVLDNLENLDDKALSDVLISFRDTLFSTPGVWWVLIGQSGLGSLIQSLDSRIFERINGSGIEIKPVKFDDLYAAIEKRVSKFHIAGHGNKAPLSQETHRMLFEASLGEMRFVFKYGNSICQAFVEDMRTGVLESFEKQYSADMKLTEDETKEMRGRIQEEIDKAIGKSLVNEQVPDEIAVHFLEQIVNRELEGLYLKPKEKEVFQKIGEKGSARPSDYKEFSVKTMQDFSSNYLTKFYKQKLLVREQQGRYVNYRLRGIMNLCNQFELLSEK